MTLRFPTARLGVAAIAGLLLGINVWAAEDPEIVEAVRAGNWPRVEALIADSVDVNAQAADTSTALHWAVRANHLPTAELLIRAGADVNWTDRYGIAPLTLSAENGSAAMADLILDAGADPNTTLPEGETALMTAARTGEPETIRVLVAYGADVNARENTMGETALMWAAGENHAEAIHTLIELGADPDAFSNELSFPEFRFLTSGMVTTVLPRGGWTALMYAARQDSIEAVQALAQHGANLDLVDPDGTSATIISIINAHFDLAATLLEHGADPNVADANGMEALHATIDMHTLGAMFSRGPPKLVDELSSVDLVGVLLDHGADPDAQLLMPIFGRHHNAGDASLGEGSTPLMRAAKSADIEMLRLLLDGDADPTLTQRNYTSALMILSSAVNPANEEEVIEVVRLFLDAGVDAAAFNSNGQTAVHNATGRGANGLIRLLAENGAKLDMADRQGRTPLDIASGRGGRGGRGGGRGGRGGAGREQTAALLRELLGQDGP